MTSIYIKNAHTTTLTYVGQDIVVGDYYQIQDHEHLSWASNSTLLSDIGSAKAVVSKSDSGSDDITDVNSAIDYLKGSSVEINNLPLSIESKAIEVTPRKPEGSSTVLTTHDWTDKTTWYNESVRVTDEVLADSGDNLTFTSLNTNWINLSNGKVYNEDSIISTGPYDIIVKEDDVVQTSGFTVDYTNGTITFNTSKLGKVIKATYSYEAGSCWILKPDAGKKLFLEHAEIQFAKNVTVNAPIHFEIWVYDPNDLPNKMLYQKITYKNVRDIINAANLGQGFIPAFDSLQNDVLVFPFNYVTTKILKDSQGAELRLKVDNDTAYGGEFATASFYVTSQDE